MNDRPKAKASYAALLLVFRICGALPTGHN